MPIDPLSYQVFAQPKPEKRKRLAGKAKKAVQLEVLERDNGTCLCCGWPVNNEPPHHIDYVSGQGEDIAGDQASLCHRCHSLIHHGSMLYLLEVIVTFYGIKRVIQFILFGMLARGK
jgi:hypothetical protein